MSLPTRIQKFRSLESDFGTTIAEAIWKRAAQLSNYIEKSYPIGMVMFFHATQPALTSSPDSKYWQELDGSAVSNTNSPLNGVTLPDLRNKFIMHPKTGEVELTTAGNDSLAYAHTHGGATGTASGLGTLDMDGGSGRTELFDHVHVINSDTITYDTKPQYIALKCYIRIA